ncbi:hypothetical protein ACFSCW_16375 [Sphingomonas tabacisoli]|uniref:Uncharacterized protein n=1 Tax=Sphingomonas tabacisoli TaxID=2249466 RepID=A0ABW4I767_9SPHN
MVRSIAVDNPERAKTALAALTLERVSFTPAAFKTRLAGVQMLPVTTALSVEAIVETACELGFHAEEIRRGIVEFWIDEGAAFELFTLEARDAEPDWPLAA